jgi:hypothetical protein
MILGNHSGGKCLSLNFEAVVEWLRIAYYGLMAKFYLATIGLLALALLGTAGARFLEPPDIERDSMACEEERDEALLEYRNHVRSCLQKASDLEQAKDCWEM